MNSKLDLFTCLEALDRDTSQIFLLKEKLSQSDYFLLTDYLKLLFCAEDWDQIIQVSSQVISEKKVTGLKVSLFYRYWLEALRAQQNWDGLEALGSHLIHLPQKKTTSKERLDLILLALVWMNQKVSARVVLEKVQKLFPEKNHYETKFFFHHCFGGHWSDSKKEWETFLKESHFLSQACLFQLNQSVELADLLLEEHPYFLPPHLLKVREAIQKGEYAQACFRLNLIHQWSPENLEGLLGLAYCHHKLGDSLTAYDLLKKYAYLARPEEWDYQELLGEICQNLFQRYADPHFQKEAIEAFQKALHMCERLHLPTISFKNRLQDLGMFEEGSLERREPLKQAGKGYWFIQSDPRLLSGLLEIRRKILLLCPRSFKKGDEIIMGNFHAKGYQAQAAFTVLTHPVENGENRFYVRLKEVENFGELFFQNENLDAIGGFMELEEDLSQSLQVFRISQKSFQWISEKARVKIKNFSSPKEPFYAS